MSFSKICIIGLKCFDHVMGHETPRYLGGIETQLAILAEGLAGQGCDVSVITYDHGQEDDFKVGGVRLLKSFDPEVGLRFVRNYHPRATSLWSAMKVADADAYLQMGGGVETWLAQKGVRRTPKRKAKFIYCAASDADVNGRLSRKDLECFLYRRALKSADKIVVQTESQQSSLSDAMDVDSEVVPMAVRLPRKSPLAANCGPKRVLWIGRIIETKRLELLVELAKACPECEFDVVGAANSCSEYSRRTLAEAAKVGNVTVHGKVSSERMEELYSSCFMLCSTSILEGFPTTFLEAWSRSVPVLTTIDPDGVVANSGAGWFVEDLPSLVRVLKETKASGTEYLSARFAAFEQFERNHSLRTVSQNFKQLVQQ